MGRFPRVHAHSPTISYDACLGVGRGSSDLCRIMQNAYLRIRAILSSEAIPLRNAEAARGGIPELGANCPPRKKMNSEDCEDCEKTKAF
jgi:hypothetical protein